MDPEVSSYNSDMEMEARHPSYDQQEMVQLSVQMMTNLQYYKVQKPPIPKKPKRVAPQPSTFHIGSGHLRKNAEYES